MSKVTYTELIRKVGVDITHPARYSPNPVATGAAIRAARIRHGMTLSGVAEIFSALLMPVSVNAISKWERGQSMPSFDHLYALSRIFEVPLNRLVVGYEDDPHGPASGFFRFFLCFLLLFAPLFAIIFSLKPLLTVAKTASAEAPLCSRVN